MSMQGIYDSKTILYKVSEAIRHAGVMLPDDVHHALHTALLHEQEMDPGSLGVQVLQAIMQNIEEARNTSIPVCQDTGMTVLFVDVGSEGGFDGSIEEILSAAVGKAYREGYFRPSIVDDPVFRRVNTGTNLPPVIHFRIVPGTVLKVSGLLKGFGSENCSSLVMLNPTAGEQGIADAVYHSVERAGGKPCPPTVIGVGIGGSADLAPILAKRALLRKVGSPNPDSRYAGLEKQILDRVNTLGIGPGGMGGGTTALAVMAEYAPTHIAGLPVAVNISCWADRKFSVEIKADE